MRKHKCGVGLVIDAPLGKDRLCGHAVYIGEGRALAFYKVQTSCKSISN